MGVGQIPLENLTDLAPSHNNQKQDNPTTQPNSSALATADEEPNQVYEENRSSAHAATRTGPSIPLAQASSATQADDGEAHGLETCPEETVERLVHTANSSENRGMHPGSAIDRTWRLSMGAFVVGALPQMIKVFGMRGILKTQITTAILLVSFLIPEILRLMAGTAGEIELHPMPNVLEAKHLLDELQVPFSSRFLWASHI